MSGPTAAEWQQALADIRALQDQVQELEERLAKEGEVNRRLWARETDALAVPLDVEDPYWGDGPGPATVAQRRSLAASVAAGHEVLSDDEAWLLDRPGVDVTRARRTVRDGHATPTSPTSSGGSRV